MDAFNEKLYPRLSSFHERGPEVSRFRQILNLLGCLIVLPIYSVITGYARHPLTLDILLTIFSAEFNRFMNEGRRQKLHEPQEKTQDLEKARISASDMNQGAECMATIVGYREDPALFARALESYKNIPECRLVLVGVDGDDVPDMEMIRVFQQVREEKNLNQIKFFMLMDNRFSQIIRRSFILTSLLERSPCTLMRRLRPSMATRGPLRPTWKLLSFTVASLREKFWLSMTSSSVKLTELQNCVSTSRICTKRALCSLHSFFLLSFLRC